MANQVNVEDLTREQLENIVIQQSAQLKSQSLQIEQLQKNLEESGDEYDELSSVVLRARQILSC